MPDLVCLDLAVPDAGAARESLRALGFAVGDAEESVRLGAIVLRLDGESGPPHGLVSWAFAGDRDERLRLDPLALPPTWVVSPNGAGEDDVGTDAAAVHPNTVTSVDHVVLMVPSLDTAVAGLEGYAGLTCSRRAEMRGRLMGFVRAGEAVVEIVEVREQETPLLWGLALRVDDLDTCTQVIRDAGGQVSDPGPAIQGGKISAAPPQACFGVSLAFMEKA